MAAPSRSFLLVASLALLLLPPPILAALDLPAPSVSGNFQVGATLEPDLPAAGDSMRLSLEIPELRGAVLLSYRLGPGLSFEASSARALVSPGGTRGSVVDVELRAVTAGMLVVEELRIEGEEAVFDLGPIELFVAPRSGLSRSPAAWSWKAPARVWRYESFPVSLVSTETVPAGTWPSFELPEGILLEAASGDFAWIATALESGNLALPSVELKSVPPARAESLPIEVLDPPQALVSSRAFGDFSLSLEGGKAVRSGEAYTARLVLSGQGNFPALILPEPRAALAGLSLPRAAMTMKRSDRLSISGSSYRGSAILELTLVPRGEGRLTIEVPSLPFLATDGSIRETRAASLTVEVSRADGPGLAATSASPPAAGFLRGLAAEVAARGGPRSRIEALTRAEEGLGSGRAGPALAAVFGLARLEDRSLRPAARELANLLGAEAPDFGPLPPAGFLLASCLLLLLALPVAVVATRRAGRRRRFSLLAALGLAAALAGGLYLFSLADEGRLRSLVWSTRLYTIPSEASELATEIGPGRSGREAGRVEGWVFIVFRDGGSGWLPADSVYSY